MPKTKPSAALDNPPAAVKTTPYLIVQTCERGQRGAVIDLTADDAKALGKSARPASSAEIALTL